MAINRRWGKVSLLFTLFFFLFVNSKVGAQGSGVYFGLYREDGSATYSKSPSLGMFFHPWNGGDFPGVKLDQIRSGGAIPVVSWQSYDPDDPNSSWESIAAGSKDEYVARWARDSKNWGHPYFLRFNWEMNGYWEPFSSQANSFVPMWKHVHDIFVQNGATNVTWVWCPNIDGDGTMPFDPLYPGNDYVDWVCMDGYNFGISQSWGKWDSFSAVFAPTYNHLLRLAPGKPIMIAEMASTEQGGSKSQWISDMLLKYLPQNFPNVKAFIWFDINKETDWRINSSEKSRLAFNRGIEGSYYASNSFGNISTSPVPYFGSLVSRPVNAAAKPTITPTITRILSASPSIVGQASVSQKLNPKYIIFIISILDLGTAVILVVYNRKKLSGFLKKWNSWTLVQKKKLFRYFPKKKR